MGRHALLTLSGVVLGIILFFWWMISWPSAPIFLEYNSDTGWKTIEKKGTAWQRISLQENSTLVSYQGTSLLIYGSGDIPTVHEGDQNVIEVTTGKWMIRSMNEKETTITGPNMNVVISGSGGVFIDVEKETIINFDADVVTNGQKLLPSFLLAGEQRFFDIGEEQTDIPQDIWLSYVSFFPRDRTSLLGDISKSFLDTMILNLIAREPESSQGFFPRDTSVRIALSEIQSLINKIANNEKCGTTQAECYLLLSSVFADKRDKFPEVFLPLEHAVQSWIQLHTDGVRIFSWKGIFQTYHAQMMAEDGRARAIRDKSILEMIRMNTTVPSRETWLYLTQMLAHEKLGSAYSLQIMREMVRIGDLLDAAPDTSSETKKILVETAQTSLANLKTLLENTYFTKKEYWFVLRDDLVDSDGRPIQGEVFVDDLNDLVQQLDTSSLMISSENEDTRVIKAQLTWFVCIFSRNAEYMNNPRVCRITRS